ncbi:CoA-binding protein [Helicobacter saguini]|uniref:CoA-binding protein n=1 Tax=Helicobacter saguini TaxID=1548018 RepID=A0A347VPF2_9HELI|nr:CoA-binding protein [Helicobacter saguini]MWV61388.1 CoA-binding protein [Helicobacter saguini]MWV67944.1 CoA-binding protein [Helicobacter saguini]MWV70589.1 CoA-binding protein [Helicobacter saguini]MWV72493.1 CoA-binding protein [Helicobacter saguini]TLD94760.1 CoA-binding protein [Helicobacter saguini]
MNKKIKNLFLNNEIKNIAVVGFSPDSTKDSHKVGMYLFNHGFNVFAIYPKGKSIGKVPIFHTLSTLLESKQIDCVVVFRKSQYCIDIAKEILKSKHKIRIFWMQLGIENNHAKEILESNNILVVENKCIMIELKSLKDIEN